MCAVGGTLNLHICHLQCTFFAGVSIKLLLPACTIFLSALLFFFKLKLSSCWTVKLPVWAEPLPENGGFLTECEGRI